MPVGDIYMGTIWTRFAQNDNAFIFCVDVTAEVVDDQMPVDINRWLEDVVVPLWLPKHNNNVVFRCVSTHQVWQTEPSEGPATSVKEVNSLGDAPGTRTLITGRAPGQCSMVAQLLGDEVDPTGRNRGRDFWYGQLLEDFETTGFEWTQSYIDEICVAYQTLTSSYTSGNGNAWEWGIFSRTQAEERIDPQYVSNGGSVPDPPTFTDPFFHQVQKIRLNPMIRTQRRRQSIDPCKQYTNCDM